MTSPAGCTKPFLVGVSKEACAGTTCEQSLTAFQASGTCPRASSFQQKTPETADSCRDAFCAQDMCQDGQARRQIGDNCCACPEAEVACMSYRVIHNGHNTATCTMTSPAGCTKPQALAGVHKEACA